MYNILALLAYENPTAGQVVGILIVMICLSFIAVVVWLVGKVMVSLENNKKAASATQATKAATQSVKVATPAPAPASASNEIAPEIIAVIAAAVDTALSGRKHRIITINQNLRSAWSTSGRNQIYASHKLK